MSLIRRLGGDEGVAALVAQLSVRVTTDPVMGPYFRDVDEESLNRHRAMFLSALLGGLHSYTGKSLPEAHGPFRLGDSEFDAFCASCARRSRRPTSPLSTVSPSSAGSPGSAAPS